MSMVIYSDKADVARKIWATIGKHTITMELQDLGDGYEHEEGLTIRLPEFKKATGLETEEDIYAFIRENFGVNNGMSKMRGFLNKNKITCEMSSYK